jgi:uncharacterized protein
LAVKGVLDLPMSVLQTLLRDLPETPHVTDIYVGANWMLALVNDAAGVASTPKQISPESRFQIGHHALNEPAHEFARLLFSDDETTAAIGLAVLNALNQPDESRLTKADAADWLSMQCAGKHIAIFGRFPFIEDEIRPFARKVTIFEQTPQNNESSSAEIASLLPEAEIVAITGSTIINHTIDTILPHVQPGSMVVMLGPSTPLNERLFECGIDALFGVRVADVEQVRESVLEGAGFQKIQGLQRMAMFK